MPRECHYIYIYIYIFVREVFPCMETPPIHGKTLHNGKYSDAWEVFSYLGRLPICGTSSHMREVFPHMGRRTMYGKTSHTSLRLRRAPTGPPVTTISIYRHNTTSVQVTDTQTCADVGMCVCILEVGKFSMHDDVCFSSAPLGCCVCV